MSNVQVKFTDNLKLVLPADDLGSTDSASRLLSAALAAVDAAIGSGRGGGTPGAPATSVQTNQAGAFVGDADFTWDNTAKQLTVGPSESTLDTNIQGYWGPSPILVTASDPANGQAIAVEAQSSGGVMGIAVVAVAQTTSGDNNAGAYAINGVAFTDSGTHNNPFLVGGQFTAIHLGSGVVTEVDGVRINSAGNDGGGTITTNIGLNIADQTAGTANYAIKTGLGLNEFGDDVQYDKLLIAGTIYSAAGTPLPAASGPLTGARAVVSDATTPLFLASYTSGGAVLSPVLCTGTDWVTA